MGGPSGQRSGGGSGRGGHPHVDVRLYRSAEQGGVGSQCGTVHRGAEPGRRACVCLAQHQHRIAHRHLLGRTAVCFRPAHYEPFRTGSTYHRQRRHLPAHCLDSIALRLSLGCLYGHLQRFGTQQDTVLHQRYGTCDEYPARPSLHLRVRLGNRRGSACHVAVRSCRLPHLCL